ncbi:MAG TPA: zinc-dependent metalloprotease [Frankiaceae bacterium]|jgi:putative hydrolase|nr:zinc-dependent metalloprotease [Frankiaceae bacterium]
MSGQFPFGFGPDSGGSGGPGGFGDGAPFFRELEKLLSWQGGPINWELARQMAVQGASSESRPPDKKQQAAVRESGRLANHWLDDVTTLPGLSGTAEELASWSRTEWVERTLPVWQTICDPVAAKVVDAMGSGVTGGLASLGNLGLGGLELPEGMKLPEGVDLSSMLGDLTGPLTGMLRQMGGLLFGAQVGQALSALASEVVGATDVGLPLGDPALLPHNVEVLAAGLEVPEDQVQLYVAVREMAHQRLFQHVPWLRGHLLGAVEEYARGITVDPEAISRAVSSIDPSALDPSSLDPERLSEMLGADAFTSPQTPEQQAALARLETALALVEGWVDEVTMAAVAGRLPAAASLQEATRRRRASGGPAEQTFAALVGLELRPRRLRDAAALWQALREQRGIEGRDAIWAHPDLLPSSADLDDPAGFVAHPGDSMDPLAEIAKLAGEAPAEGTAQKRVQDAADERDGRDPGDDTPPEAS